MGGSSARQNGDAAWRSSSTREVRETWATSSRIFPEMISRPCPDTRVIDRLASDEGRRRGASAWRKGVLNEIHL
jgi:hypothetical protein